MTLIILGLCCSLLGLAATVFGIAIFREGMAEDKRLPPWTLVYDGHGNYSYIGFDGELVSANFSVREDAEIELAKSRQWHADYAAGKMKESLARLEAEKLAREQAMKPCCP